MNDDPHKPEGKLTLKIAKFSEFAAQNGICQSDPVFIQGIPWKIQAARNQSATEYMAISLECAPEQKPKYDAWTCEALFAFKLRRQQAGTGGDGDGVAGDEQRVEEHRHVFCAAFSVWKCPHYKKFEELLRPENGWYDTAEDTITLEAVLKAKIPRGFGIDLAEAWRRSMVINDNPAISGTLVCQNSGTEFEADKRILAAHSNVFRAMFTNAENAQAGAANGENAADAANHMQSPSNGHAKLPEEKADNTHAEEPLAAQEEEEMIESLSIDNVCARLALADRHNAQSLRDACDRMIRDNLAEVKKQDGWKAMKETHPYLLLDILEKLAKERCKKN